MVKYLGFDFGTSNSVVSVFDTNTQEVVTVPISNYDDPRLNSLANGSLFPSKIGTKSGQYFFGDDSKVCFRNFIWDNSKRLLDSFNKMSRFHDTRSGLEIAVGIMTGISIALRNKNIDLVNKTCLSVPSNSYSLQRAQTKIAAETSGFNVQNLVSEPCAAALSMVEDIKKTKILLVIDIGGGTTDVALIENKNGVMKEISVSGIKKLGGMDIDQSIYSEIKSAFRDLNDAEELLLLDECEKAKIELTEKHSTFFEFRKQEVELTRERLEEICKPFVLKVEKVINNLIAESDYSIDQIDSVIPVGGTTLVPSFRTMFYNLFGDKVQDTSIDDALTAVSRGAAIASAIFDGNFQNITFQQCLEHSVALRVENNIGTKDLSLLIKKGTPYPASYAKKYEPRYSESRIALYETISLDFYKDDSVLLNEWKIKTNQIMDSYVWITVDYNQDGVIELSAYQVDKNEDAIKGDLLETNISKKDYEKLTERFNYESLNETINPSDIIYDYYSKETILSWRENFLGNAVIEEKKEEAIEKLSEEKIKNLTSKHTLNTAFLALEKSWIDTYTYVLNDCGIKSKEDIKVICESIDWNPSEISLEDGRLITRIFLNAKDIKLLKKYKKKKFQNEIGLIHNLTNSYFHRRNRKEINYGEQVKEIDKAIEKGTLASRWFQKTELDPVFFNTLSQQYIKVLEEFYRISKIQKLNEIKREALKIIENVNLKFN